MTNHMTFTHVHICTTLQGQTSKKLTPLLHIWYQLLQVNITYLSVITELTKHDRVQRFVSAEQAYELNKYNKQKNRYNVLSVDIWY